MHNMICAIIHLCVTYQKDFSNLIQFQYIVMFQDQSTASSLYICISMLAPYSGFSS